MIMLKDFIDANRNIIHKKCEENAVRNEHGELSISPSDDWFYEDEWDELYEEVYR